MQFLVHVTVQMATVGIPVNVSCAGGKSQGYSPS